MMGKKQSKFPIMEKFELEGEEKSFIQAPEFWSTYYRHNNYFYLKNKELLRTVRKDNTKKGLETLISKKSQMNDGNLAKKLFNNRGLLSHWGVRSVSLNDVIRYMTFLNFELGVINKICDEITNAFENKMDKKLAYKVFRETEDEFSLRNYVKVESKKIGGYVSKGDPDGDKLFALEKVFDFLPIEDKFEISLICKKFRGKVKEKYFEDILRSYELDQDSRVKIWWQIVPEVKKYLKKFQEFKSKKMRDEIKSDDEDLEIITLDLNRSTRFFDEKKLDVTPL